VPLGLEIPLERGQFSIAGELQLRYNYSVPDARPLQMVRSGLSHSKYVRVFVSVCHVGVPQYRCSLYYG